MYMCICVHVYMCIVYVCVYVYCVCVFREIFEPIPQFAQNVETERHAIGGHSDVRC